MTRETTCRTGAQAAAVAALLAVAGCGSSGSHAGSGASSTPASVAGSSSAAAGSACERVEADLGGAATSLASAISNPKQAQPAVTQFLDRLKADAAGANPQVQQAVSAFADQVEKAVKSAASGGKPDIPGLTGQADRIGQLCSNTAASGSTSAAP